MPTEEEEPEREKESKVKHMIHLGLAETGGRHLLRAKISWPPLSQLFTIPVFVAFTQQIIHNCGSQ